jgi:hypothetical protein
MGRAAKPRKAKEPEPPAPEEHGGDATDQSIPRKGKAGRSSTAKAPPQADPITRALEEKEADEPAQAQAARMAEDLEEDWDLTGVIPPFKLDDNQKYQIRMMHMSEDGYYLGAATSRASRRGDADSPTLTYDQAVWVYQRAAKNCLWRQGQFNSLMNRWLRDWAAKHASNETDTTQWLNDQMDRRGSKDRPDPLREENRPTEDGWQNWIEWGRNEAPPAYAGRPKDDRSEEPSQEEQKDNRSFRGKSHPGRTAPLFAAAGGGIAKVGHIGNPYRDTRRRRV